MTYTKDGVVPGYFTSPIGESVKQEALTNGYEVSRGVATLWLAHPEKGWLNSYTGIGPMDCDVIFDVTVSASTATIMLGKTVLHQVVETGDEIKFHFTNGAPYPCWAVSFAEICLVVTPNDGKECKVSWTKKIIPERVHRVWMWFTTPKLESNTRKAQPPFGNLNKLRLCNRSGNGNKTAFCLLTSPPPRVTRDFNPFAHKTTHRE